MNTTRPAYTKDQCAKMDEAVKQIGRLITVCAKNNLSTADILVVMQTATSLLCEMNGVTIETYIKLLKILHKERMHNGS